MNHQRIKIGQQIISLENVVSAYRTASGKVFVEMTFGTWIPKDEEGETFWNYYLRWGQAIKAGEFAVNRSYIALAHWVSPSRLHVCTSCDRLNPLVLWRGDAQQFWEAYTGDCIDLSDYQPPRAKLQILDQFNETATSK